MRRWTLLCSAAVVALMSEGAAVADDLPLNERSPAFMHAVEDPFNPGFGQGAEFVQSDEEGDRMIILDRTYEQPDPLPLEPDQRSVNPAYPTGRLPGQQAVTNGQQLNAPATNQLPANGLPNQQQALGQQGTLGQPTVGASIGQASASQGFVGTPNANQQGFTQQDQAQVRSMFLQAVSGLSPAELNQFRQLFSQPTIDRQMVTNFIAKSIGAAGGDLQRTRDAIGSLTAEAIQSSRATAGGQLGPQRDQDVAGAMATAITASSLRYGEVSRHLISASVEALSIETASVMGISAAGVIATEVTTTAMRFGNPVLTESVIGAMLSAIASGYSQTGFDVNQAMQAATSQVFSVMSRSSFDGNRQAVSTTGTGASNVGTFTLPANDVPGISIPDRRR